jgi:dienelactone hydrolase
VQVRQCPRVYKHVPDPRAGGAIIPLIADVYSPAAANHAPMLELIHGGGWHTGLRSLETGRARTFASEGFVVFNIDYRLAPCPSGDGACLKEEQQGALSGTALQGQGELLYQDARDALVSERQFGALYGGGGKLGAFGGSAGGHLAALVATEGTPGGSRADAAVSWSGPLVLDPYVWQRYGVTPAGADAGTQAIMYLMGCTPVDAQGVIDPTCAPTWQAFSPSFYLGAPKLAIRALQSVDDPIVQSESFAWMFTDEAARLGTKGVQRWIWNDGVSCIDGSKPIPPGGKVPPGGCGYGWTEIGHTNYDCGGSHGVFNRCVYRDNRQHVDIGDPRNPNDDVILPALYNKRTEQPISTCFLFHALTGEATAGCLNRLGS